MSVELDSLDRKGRRQSDAVAVPVQSPQQQSSSMFSDYIDVLLEGFDAAGIADRAATFDGTAYRSSLSVHHAEPRVQNAFSTPSAQRFWAPVPSAKPAQVDNTVAQRTASVQLLQIALTTPNFSKAVARVLAFFTAVANFFAQVAKAISEHIDESGKQYNQYLNEVRQVPGFYCR